MMLSVVVSGLLRWHSATLTPSLCPQGIMLLFMGVTASHGLGRVPLLPLEQRDQLL